MGVRAFLDISQMILSENTISARFSGGANFSFPMLLKRRDKIFDAMFVYAPDGDRSPRPHAWLLLDCVGGQVSMLCDCVVNDFADTEKYPPGSVVSLEMSRHLPPDLKTKAHNNLYEIYEQLRLFAFEPDPADWQFEAMAQYRALFLQLAPIGLYPFYHALAPEFCAWIGLSLAEKAGAGAELAAEPGLPAPEPEGAPEDGAAGRGLELSTGTPPPQSGPEVSSPTKQITVEPAVDAVTPAALHAILDEIAALRQAITDERGKNGLLDAMHAELTEYKNGLIQAITAPIENDIIKIIDDMEKSYASYKRKNPTRDNYRRLLTLLQGFETDLCDALYRQGMEPFRVDGNEVDIRRQKILAVKPTEKESMDKKTAQRHGRGWEKNDKIIRPERISVYVYEPQGEADKADTESEGE